ncbi:MAG: uncharacterized protein K0R12_1265 [Gammaproteobacteria bacterium]|jgi:hypothetical protein|nr:uncharacterized protein [Gammaproteobacteria bacterium]
MITLDANAITRHLDLVYQVQLRDLFRSSYDYSEHNYPSVRMYSNSAREDELEIKEQIGHTSLSANELLFYPILAKRLRKMTVYPFYKAIVPVEDIIGFDQCGVENAIKQLIKLQNRLKPFQEEKAKLDQYVNNLIMLYGQEKTKPIYEGSKLYERKETQKRWGRSYRIFSISGLKYSLNEIPVLEQARPRLYRLNVKEFLRKHLNVYHVKLVGGIVKTPILIFRAIKSYNQRGSLCYLDLYTDTVTHKLSEARKMAASYAKDQYIIDLWEKSVK